MIEEWFIEFDDRLRGWPKVILLIIAEIFIVFFGSNIPFILTALKTQTNPPASFFDTFTLVLQAELNRGQELAFVCALVAPVLFWALTEFKKAVVSKILTVCSIIILIGSAFLYGDGREFFFISSFEMYKYSLLLWMASIVAHNIPPEPKTPGDEENEKVAQITQYLDRAGGH